MDRRRAAAALLALAACFACSTAAPTSDQTALDLYEEPAEGCYYNFQHYGEGDRIMTNEPCLNCTCHNKMLMCYLRVCPFTKAIGQDCTVEKRADQCCPIVTCPDVPVDLLTSTSTSSPAEYGGTGLGKVDNYGCTINGKYFPEGAKVPPTPNKPCEHCYCIRNMTTCVMQECTLHVDGCTPIYHKDVCCPVRYFCDHPEDEIPLLDDMTTTVRPTPGFLLTTTTEIVPTTEVEVKRQCVENDQIHEDGALIKKENPCEHCYCMKGDIVCVVQECGTPMENEGKNCTSVPPREGQCCPDTYICEGDELPSEFVTKSPFEDITTTLQPPRRVAEEGSGYRKDETPFTEIPTFASEAEGSGEEAETSKPTEAFMPDSQTTPEFATTEEGIQHVPLTTMGPVFEDEVKETTEPDRGLNTIEEEVTESPESKPTTPVIQSDITVPALPHEAVTSEESQEPSLSEKTTTQEGIIPTEMPEIPEKPTTVIDVEDMSEPSIQDLNTSKDEFIPVTTEPAQIHELTTLTTSVDVQNSESTLPPKETTAYSDLIEEETKKTVSDDAVTTVSDATTEIYDENKLPTISTSDTTDVTFKDKEEDEEGSGLDKTTTEPEGSGHNTIPEDITEYSVLKTTSSVLQELTTEPSKYTSADEMRTTIQPVASEEMQTTLATDDMITKTETFTTIDDSRGSETDKADEDKATTEPQEKTTLPPSDDETADQEITVTKQVVDSATTEPQEMTTTPERQDLEATKPGEQEVTSVTEANIVSTTSEVEKQEVPDVNNPDENEIAPPGRIPGEGDCLLNGITYQNESSVPSTNKCYSNCRCLSSIVKCDPIICSPQPEYMNNCQPVYDTPESCCPTYVCDHSQETVPPQSHSQMSGTDSPLPSPSVECEGDECKPIEDKQPVPTSPTECTSDSCQSEVEPKPDGVSCGPDGCDEIVQKPVDACPNGLCELPPTKEQVPPSPSAGEGPLCDNPEDCKRIKEPEQEVSPSCKGDSCIVPKPQECNKEGGCDKPQPKPCEGEHCEIQPESGTSKPQEDCNEEDGCKETKLPEICDKEGGCDTPHEPCQGENCKVLPETGTGKPQQDCNTDEGCKEGTVPEICNEEGGCDKPQEEQCEGENCNVLPETGTGKPQEDCNNEDGCKDATLPQTVIPPCEGESCPGIKEQSCDTETGCKNVESQPCEGNNCEKQPVAPHCAGEDCQKTETTGTIAPDCEGDSCVNVNVPVQPIETCEGKQCDAETNLGTEKPSDECTGPECLQQPETVDKTTDNVQDITETTIIPAGQQDTKHTVSPTTESTYLHPQSTEDISTDVDKEHPHESSETSEPGDKITSIPQDITTEPIEFSEDKQTESPSPIVTELPEMQVTDFRRKEESLSTEIEENPTDKPTISETTAKMETITPSVEHEITTPTSLVTEPQEIPQKEKPEDEDTLTTIEQDESVTEPSSSGILKEQTDKSTDIPQIADKDALTTVTSLTQDEQVTEYPTPGTSEEETVKTTEVPHISEKETEHPDSTKKDMEESTTLGLEINTIDTEPAIEGETKTSEMSTKELPEGVTKPYPIDELKTTLSEFITESAVSAEVTTTKPLPADEEVPQEGTTSNIPLASEDVIETQTSITEGLLSTEKTEIVTDAPKEEAEDEVVSTSTIDNDSLSGGSITTTKIPEQTKQKPEEVSTYKPVDEDYVTPSQEVTKQPEEETTDNQTSKLDLVTELPELPTTIKELYETITPESDVTDKEKVHTEAPLSLETIKQDIDDTLQVATSPKPEDISTDSLPIFTKESEPTIEDEFKVKTEKPEITEPQSLDDRNELSTKPTEKEKDVTESPQTEVKTEIPVEVTEADEAITVKEQITTESSESPVTSAAEFTPTAESSTKIPEKVETEKPIITSEIGTSTEAVTQEQDTEPPTQHLDTIPPKDSQEDIKTESPVTISTEINTEAEPGIHPEVTKQSSATEPSHKDDSTTEVDELLTTKTLPVTETTESNIPSQEKDVTEIPSLYDQKTNEPEIMTDEQKTDEPEVHDDDKKTEKPLITEDKTQDKTESPEIVTEEQIHLTEPPTSQADYSTVEGDHITQKPDFTKEEITTTEVSLPKVTSFVDDDSSKVAETNEPEISATQPTYDEKQTEGPNVQPETKPSDDTDQTEPEIKTEEPLVFPTKETTPHELEEMPVKDVTATTSEPIEPIEMDEINTEAPKEGDTQVPTDSPILVDTKETEESSEQPFITVTDQQEEEVITDHTRRKEPTPTIPPEKPEVIENDENLTKSPEEQELPTSSSPDYSETTPYLVELEEHPHVEGQTTPGPLEDMSATPPFEEKEQTPEISSDSIQTTAKPFMETEKPVDATLSGEEETISPTDVPVSVQGSEPSIPVHIDEQTDNKYGTDQPKEQEIASTEGLHTIPDEEKQTTSVPIIDTEKPVSQDTEEESKPDKDLEPSTLKPASPQFETTTPEEFITAKVTTAKAEEEVTTQSVPLDKFTKPDEKPTEPLYTATPETQKPGLNELQPTDEVPPSEDDGQFPPSGGYGQEPDYGDEDQAFGPGTCRYGGKVYVSAQQIPRDDPCDFCFCFRSDIICLQQSCPPPIHGCHEEPIQGFCCPRYECPVSMATAVNVTTTSTTTTTTLPPHFLPHAYKGAAQRRGCLIKGHTYKVGELVRASSGPCLHCTCGGDGQMKCDPKVCTPEPMLRQMIAAAVSAKRRR